MGAVVNPDGARGCGEAAARRAAAHCHGANARRRARLTYRPDRGHCHLAIPGPSPGATTKGGRSVRRTEFVVR